LIVWEDSGHCIYERFRERDDVLCDWFNRKLA